MYSVAIRSLDSYYCAINTPFTTYYFNDATVTLKVSANVGAIDSVRTRSTMSDHLAMLDFETVSRVCIRSIDGRIARAVTAAV